MSTLLSLVRFLGRLEAFFGPVSLVPLADGTYHGFSGVIPMEPTDRSVWGQL